nr:carotene cleavage dioxygenase 4 copy 2 [Bixa orellana]
MYYSSIPLPTTGHISYYNAKKKTPDLSCLYRPRERVLKLFFYEVLPSIQTYPRSFKFNHKMTSETTEASLPASSLSTQASKASHLVYSFFSNAVAPPLEPSVDPKNVFKGNFAPVEELPPTECLIVEGEIPTSLDGAAYIRNGTNPQYIPDRALHFFEGDGMLHSLRFSNGRAVYCSRYVKTYKFLLEKAAGAPRMPNMLSGLYGLKDVSRFIYFYILQILIGKLNTMKGLGGANTSLAFFGKKLLALCESDLPYIIKLTEDNDIDTLERWEFDKKWMASMTAHPKVDEDTMETFAFKYCWYYPYLTFFHFDENGVKQNEVCLLSLKQPFLIHDFAVTKRFVIFQETQLRVSLMKTMLGRGALVNYARETIPKIGVLPRYATNESDLMLFQVPGFNALHIINAWENGEDEIIVVGTNIKSIENIFSRRVNSSLDKVIINTRTGKVSMRPLSSRSLELGTINNSYAGKRNRYAYMGVMEEVLKCSGVVKIDLETGHEVASRFYGAGCFGGEPLFVKNKHAEWADEDDGYILSYVHDENTQESKFIVLDARSPDLQVVAAVKMPRRVPYGAHGIFLSTEDISSL